MTGHFITIEGGEGAGKSTQLRLLADWLHQRGIAVTTTREPGGSLGAEAIRKLLVEGAIDRWDAMTEALLHFAARRDHLTKTVWPALQRGEWVISDRFADSTMAYQGYGHGLGRSAIERLYAVAVGDFKPDLTLILDIPVEFGLQRALARSGAETRYEKMDVQFHHRLRHGFLEIAHGEPNRCKLIDAQGSLEQVQDKIREAISAILGVRP
ncbi:MAG: dTMP kinase [Rhodospirillales bacterium]